MPVVHPGALDDAVILLLADFPPTVIGFVDDEFPNVVLTPQPLGKNHSVPFRNVS